jgi:hypothetical protein
VYLVQQALIRLVADLKALQVRWALVGGFAVAVYAEPRTTRDIDLALAVSDEAELNAAVLGLRMRGYRDHPDGAILEHADGRLATVRLISPPVMEVAGVVVDLLFASSGVEAEVVAGAQARELIPGLVVPVVQAGHLLALKVLAGRPKDIVDVQSVVLELRDSGELESARRTLTLIAERGFHRGKDLQEDFTKAIESAERDLH